MGRRNRFTGIKVDRLYLADVHRDRLETLKKDGVTENGITRKATKDELHDAEIDLIAAEADGDWIDVKHELSAGEARKSFAQTVKSMEFGTRAQLDPEQVMRARTVAYLVGWSFVDDQGDPVPYEESAVDNLDTETFGEISAAVQKHETTVEAAKRAEREKNLSGVSR